MLYVAIRTPKAWIPSFKGVHTFNHAFKSTSHSFIEVGTDFILRITNIQNHKKSNIIRRR